MSGVGLDPSLGQWTAMTQDPRAHSPGVCGAYEEEGYTGSGFYSERGYKGI